jgi:branched-subunit amino acid ABC-type transport system permease component
MLEFVRKGLVAWGLGPVVLAIVYGLIGKHHAIDVLTVQEVCIGIFSLSALAFVAGGMNVIYQIERLPLMAAVGIHGTVLYIGYLITYLVNGWLEWGTWPILVFSGIFAAGYLAIWAVIYAVTQRRTANINRLLKQKQQTEQA